MLRVFIQFYPIKIQLALVADHQGPAVDQQFAAGEQCREAHKDQEAVVAAPDLPKAPELLARLWGEVQHGLLEPYPRIDQRDQNVREDVANQQQQAGQQHHAHDHRVVAIEDRGQTQQAKAVDIENGFNEE